MPPPRSAPRWPRSSPTARRPWWSRSSSDPMLRKAILAYGVVAVMGAILLAIAGIITGLVVVLFVNGAVVLAALLFERGRYRPSVSPDGPWQETAERFVDPTTGQLMKVRYNTQTGARDYVPVSPQPDPPPKGLGSQDKCEP